MKMKQVVLFVEFLACTRTGIDPEKRNRRGTAARQDNTSRQIVIFIRWMGAWQCGQGQFSELARSNRREVCSPPDVDGYRGELIGLAGCNSSKTGRRYSLADEKHEWQSFAADSSDGRIDESPDDNVGRSCWWSSQQEFWAVTTDITATTATSKLEYPSRSKQAIWSRESN